MYFANVAYVEETLRVLIAEALAAAKKQGPMCFVLHSSGTSNARPSQHLVPHHSQDRLYLDLEWGLKQGGQLKGIQGELKETWR